MSDSENRYTNHDTDLLARYLRDIPSEYDGHGLTSEQVDKLLAAADRLEALHHAQPVSARVSSEGTSERDIVLAKRAGYLARQCDCSLCEAQAAQLFPLPKITRPLRVTLSDGSVWSYERRDGDLLLVRHASARQGIALLRPALMELTPDDCRAIARVLSGETELVDDVSSLPALDGRD